MRCRDIFDLNENDMSLDLTCCPLSETPYVPQNISFSLRQYWQYVFSRLIGFYAFPDNTVVMTMHALFFVYLAIVSGRFISTRAVACRPPMSLCGRLPFSALFVR